MWMAGPRESVAKGEYSVGPNPHRMPVQIRMEADHILVYKDQNGVVKKAFDGANNLEPYNGTVT